MKHKHLNARGFTMIELVVTAAFVATVATAAVEIFVAIGDINRQAHNMAVATELAQQKMETYRDAGYSAIPATSDFTSSMPTQLAAPRSATTTFSDLSPVDPGLKRLDITLNYTDGGLPKSVKLSTLVAAEGIDR